MTNTIDELMFRIEETLATPWPELGIPDKEGLIDYYRNLRASYDGGVAPRMKKNMPAPEAKAKLRELGLVKKVEGPGLRRI
jgi:hypothetical protein